jgi:predicted dehydrogenase
MGLWTDLTGWGHTRHRHIASVFVRDLALLPNEARLVAVGSTSRWRRAMGFAADHGIPRCLRLLRRVGWRSRYRRCLYVASSHHDHFGSAKLCLEAGKSVLVEKPPDYLTPTTLQN